MTCASPCVNTITSPASSATGSPAGDGGVAPSRRYRVISDQVVGALQDLRQDHRARQRLDGPRLAAGDVKKRRAGQPHRSQQIGQDIGSHKASAGREE